MQVPIGVSGVHAVPNTLHSQGLIARAGPPRTGTPGGRPPGWRDVEAPSASKRAYFSRMRIAESGIQPRPRHSKVGRGSITSSIACSAFWLPSQGTTPGVLVLHLGAALAELEKEHLDRLEDVERLEARRPRRDVRASRR